MPTYDYECASCGHTFEQFQSITAPALRKCPACKKSRVKRLIGMGAGIIFKGSGFYQTDYRSDSYKSAAKADAEQASGKPATETKSATEAKSDKPADSKTAGSKSAKSEKPAKSEAGGKD